MLGCELCMEDIARKSTSAAKLWLDCIGAGDPKDPLLILQKPNKRDQIDMIFLEENGYIKTTENHIPDRIYILLTMHEDVACKNPDHCTIT